MRSMSASGALFFKDDAVDPGGNAVEHRPTSRIRIAACAAAQRKRLPRRPSTRRARGILHQCSPRAWSGPCKRARTAKQQKISRQKETGRALRLMGEKELSKRGGRASLICPSRPAPDSTNAVGQGSKGAASISLHSGARPTSSIPCWQPLEDAGKQARDAASLDSLALGQGSAGN